MRRTNYTYTQKARTNEAPYLSYPGRCRNMVPLVRMGKQGAAPDKGLRCDRLDQNTNAAKIKGGSHDRQARS